MPLENFSPTRVLCCSSARNRGEYGNKGIETEIEQPYTVIDPYERNWEPASQRQRVNWRRTSRIIISAHALLRILPSRAPQA